jgi:uncharacterized RDD family membrane protein YckC
MTQEEREDFCNICKNHRISPNLGVICSLTNRPADFDYSCSDIKVDMKLSRIYARNNHTEIKVSLASRKHRFFNLIIDLFSIVIFYFITIIIVALGFRLLDLMFRDINVILYLRDLQDKLFGFLLFFSPFAYYSLCEAFWGKTFGKVITKTKVINRDGSEIGLGKAILRTLCRLIPFEYLSYFEEERTGWHDRFTKTIVIDD